MIGLLTLKVLEGGYLCRKFANTILYGQGMTKSIFFYQISKLDPSVSLYYVCHLLIVLL